MFRNIIRIFCLICSLCISSFANESNSLMTFSTIGPDRYSDGSVVLDGEYYALVWQSSNINEIKFTLLGQSNNTNDAVVLRALPRALNGHLPSTTFSINSSEMPKITSNGILKMYLLDTRIYVNGIAVVGNMNSVQASIPVTSECTISTKTIEGKIESNVFTISTLPDYILNPYITNITVSNNIVTMTVKNTFNGVNYTAMNPLDNIVYSNSVPVTGKTCNNIEVVVPCENKKIALFQIIRK